MILTSPTKGGEEQNPAYSPPPFVCVGARRKKNGFKSVTYVGPPTTRKTHPGCSDPKVRSAGDYALTVGDALPHLERGGEKGGIVFFGSHCNDGILYEILDEDLKVVADVTIESLVADWNANT